MSDILNIISLVSFVLAGILLVLAVVLFFVFKIPSVWGDLSGKNARKSIERMRQNNEKTGKKAHVPSNVNLQRGKLTDKIQETQKSNIKDDEQTAVLNNSNITSELKDTNATEILVYTNATALLVDDNATTLLVDDNATTLLSDYQAEQPDINNAFDYIENIIIIHTNEVIS